jgi:hypothetical protein
VSRWFRFYDDTLNDPKALKLTDSQFRGWVGLLCVASKHGGTFPPVEDLALMLRTTPQKVAALLVGLEKAELVDRDETGSRPHNWNARQYKSDVSTTRVKQFRERQRNVSCNGSETPSETEQNQRQNRTDSEQRLGIKNGVAKERASPAFRRASPTSDPANRKAAWEQKVQAYMAAHWSQARSDAAILAYLEGSDFGKAEYEAASTEMNAVKTDGSIPKETHLDKDRLLGESLAGMARLRGAA